MEVVARRWESSTRPANVGSGFPSCTPSSSSSFTRWTSTTTTTRKRSLFSLIPSLLQLAGSEPIKKKKKKNNLHMYLRETWESERGFRIAATGNLMSSQYPSGATLVSLYFLPFKPSRVQWSALTRVDGLICKLGCLVHDTRTRCGVHWWTSVDHCLFIQQKLFFLVRYCLPAAIVAGSCCHLPLE